jgi:hypothetical protein
MRKLLIAAAAVAVASTPAIGQINAAPGLITVTVQDVSVLNNFLNGAQIAALNQLTGPITVEAPISAAANICGTTVAALSALRKAGNGACTATSGSQALADIVNRQKLKQNK